MIRYTKRSLTNPVLALALYDLLISFAQEIQHIWRRKFSLVTLLYIFIRYGTIISLSLILFQQMHRSQSITVSNYLYSICFCQYWWSCRCKWGFIYDQSCANQKAIGAKWRWYWRTSSTSYVSFRTQVWVSCNSSNVSLHLLSYSIRLLTDLGHMRF